MVWGSTTCINLIYVKKGKGTETWPDKAKYTG